MTPNFKIQYMIASMGIIPEDDHYDIAMAVIRECIDIVLDSSVEYATRPQIAGEIKEHFGVEL